MEPLSRRHEWILRARRLHDELVDTPVGQLLVALREVQLRDRALTLAGQAFIALVPLLIVVASWIGSTGGAEVAEWLIARFELSGESAEAARALFSRPPSPSGGTTLLGLLILLISVNSFGRALQRTFEAAWRLPHKGSRRALRGALGTGTLVASIAIVAFVTGVSSELPGGPLLAVPLQLLVAIPCWWVLTRLLLNLRVGWRDSLPGAALGAVTQVMTGWAGSIWVPVLIERDAARYGVVGVAVALVSWLVVIAFVAVASAVTGAWASRMLVELRADRPAWPR